MKRTIKICRTKETAQKYIEENELSNVAEIKEVNTDRSDPRWTHKSYFVMVPQSFYVENIDRFYA